MNATYRKSPQVMPGKKGKKPTKTDTKASTDATSRPSRKRKEIDYNEDRLGNAVEEGDLEEKHTSGGKERKSGIDAKVLPDRQPLPSRSKDGTLHFKDHPDFTPNLTPAEVLQRGSFGGTYFRPIYSSVTDTQYDGNVWKEFPSEWFKGLDIKTEINSKTYRTSVNKYGVKCGTDLDQWEEKGWLSNIDPYGWFMWYCRFYLGRRSTDDVRQIGRGKQLMGPTGRFRTRLLNMILRSGKSYDDKSVSPVIRQTLQHWGYVVTQEDLTKYGRRMAI